jgi:transposase InsO family protein
VFRRGIVGWDTSGRHTSLDFSFAAGDADMQLSFGSTGDAYDNAAMETFWARLKVGVGWIPQLDLVRDPGRSRRLPVRVHRGLLQPPTPPSRPRAPHPSRLR